MAGEPDVSAEVRAVAEALAADLECSCPIAFAGEDGWYAVAERVLIAAAPWLTTRLYTRAVNVRR